MKAYLQLRYLTLVLAGAASLLTTNASAASWIRCPSHHDTGTFWFDPYAHVGHLRLTGFGTFQGNYPIDLELRCEFRATGRRRWDCVEPAPGVHPDGRHRVGIDISYESYLPVAFRESTPGTWMVVDDFGCEMNGGVR